MYYRGNWHVIREQALERDGRKCFYCETTEDLQVHHMRPLSRGGTNALWNLITLCFSCHVSEHQEIREQGLAVIPGPAWEPYRFLLTDHDAVLAYAARLDAEGRTGDVLRGIESRRPGQQGA